MNRLCPEGEYRDSLSDNEFWNHVYGNQTFKVDFQTVDPEDELPDEDIGTTPPSPCVVCGSITACAYDSEGKPLIHAYRDEEQEDE